MGPEVTTFSNLAAGCCLKPSHHFRILLPREQFGTAHEPTSNRVRESLTIHRPVHERVHKSILKDEVKDEHEQGNAISSPWAADDDHAVRRLGGCPRRTHHRPVPGAESQ